MQLTDQQKQKVGVWVAEGCGLSEIQRRLNSEFQINALYMDVRLLLIELGLEVKETKPKTTAAPVALDGTQAKDLVGEDAPGDSKRKKGVSVDVDRITHPGSIVSGTVTFSDGAAGKWMLDQMGRLALEMDRPNYRPSQADVQAFQALLTKKIEGMV